MGASSSTVTAGIKNQVDGKKNPLYKFADVTGNGILAVLAKEVLKSRRYELLDNQIRENIGQMLYNNGEGEMIPIEEIIAIRHKERTGNTFNAPPSQLKKFICWRIDCRGSVGETLLHVCFISGLPPHMKLLAQRLLYIFPKIINDYYICDEYYGETALHMAISSENIEVVRFLLKCGASVDQRCCGNFFTADDQKDTRTDTTEFEHVELSRHTRYTGHLYWGEYPLSFAACLSQEECIRMLVVYGADPNWQDTNGNTVLHICAIRGNWEMFDLFLSLGAKLHILNRQGLTPLTTAAYLAKKDMFVKIMTKEKVVLWTYGDVRCSHYPLEHIDSIEPSSGKINRNSALALVVYGNTSEHLNLLPNLIEKLVHKKWVTYGKKTLYTQFAIYIIYFIIVFSCFLIRPTPFEREKGTLKLPCLFKMSFKNNPFWTHKRYIIYTILNILSTVGAGLYLLQAYSHIRNIGRKMYFLSLSGFPAKAIFLISCILMLLTFVFRILCMHEVEDVIWIINVLLTSLMFLFYLRGFKLVGPFVLMLYKIIIRDLLRFFLIYSIIVIGFSQAFYIIFIGYKRINGKSTMTKEDTNIMGNISESYVRMFIMSLTEFSVFFEELQHCDLTTLGIITFMVYMLFVTLLLINMLIAMMTNTYTEVSENSLEWLRQWSAIILMMEQSFTPEMRLKYQVQYSSPMEDGKRIALLVKQRLSQE
ncbi:Nanchung [Strongyloides ratti]|uniref:Nanchung n=1 Tax=Strongyloides ratti TaxID=34506 RepID=A0A090N0L5_STRRB|nr:Nanchung [Strongyloides ratti]CEF70898.1 Nanchung [Strongyloides ratti]